MQFNQWLAAVGLTVPLGVGIHLLTWQYIYSTKPKWLFRTIAAALLTFWFGNVALTMKSEAKLNCTTILHCTPKK